MKRQRECGGRGLVLSLAPLTLAPPPPPSPQWFMACYSPAHCQHLSISYPEPGGDRKIYDRKQWFVVRRFIPKVKVPLRSNCWYSFFYISVHNMTFLYILPNFNPLRTLEVICFGLLFLRIYGRHFLTLFQGLSEDNIFIFHMWGYWCRHGHWHVQAITIELPVYSLLC